MSARFHRNVGAIAEIIGCTPDRYLDMYRDVGAYSDDLVASQALGIVLQCGNNFQVKEKEYQLATLLSDMVSDAPHKDGRRFAAVAIILAYQHDKLVELARKWIEDFVLKLLSMSVTMDRKSPEPAIGWDVRSREKNKCAITQCNDLTTSLQNGWRGMSSKNTDELHVEYLIPLPSSNLMSKLEIQ
ncbi:hypothetical protein CPC08DRAFT_769766 [Agrocybe pediades]|nr:hypothetical protein CPC08DRAFT_769766 [Agrocybe pediades]